jgi:two-component system, LytTR family, sensor kinase
VILSPLLLLFANALSNDSSVIERSFNFGVGSALSALLLVLALRSTGENRVARFGFAVCALTFTLSAGTEQIAFCLGQSAQSLTVRLAGDLAFCAAAAWPVTILGLWVQGPYSSACRRRVGRAVLAAACFSAVLLSFAHGIGVLPHHIYFARDMGSPVERFDLTAYNGMFFLWLGAFVFLPGRMRGRLSWVSITALLTGITLVTMRALEEHIKNVPFWVQSFLIFCKPFSILLVVAGGLFDFSRFRFSDIFAQKALRILLGASLALGSSFLARTVFGLSVDENMHSGALAVLGFAAIVWVAIICYARITMLSDWLVDRQIFRQADYHHALKSFREAIATESEPVAIFNTAKELVRSALRIEDASVRSYGTVQVGSGGLLSADFARDGMFPIQKGEEPAPFYLAISPGPGRHMLFSAEIDFLREVCLAIGRRLEVIDREKENIEMARREAQLVKQLVEAELRALRAQINPHFLFNSLNSVAALITAEPRVAEEIIVRLAKIFRHVLTHHDRPFSSIDEEISFLRTYLQIEKVRFGERLQVNFDIQESVLQFLVPTLILQPLVENSIKHGLGPKVGENRLTIRARQRSDYLELTVEDNGVGASTSKKLSGRSFTGFGLRNVEERLQTVYRGNARFAFESQPQTGSRAQILIPIPAQKMRIADRGTRIAEGSAGD